MKKKQRAVYAEVRNKLALFFLGAILIIPSVSVLGWNKGLNLTDKRKVGGTPAFAMRVTDKDDKNMNPFYQSHVSDYPTTAATIHGVMNNMMTARGSQ